jgi:hypothetical protein
VFEGRKGVRNRIPAFWDGLADGESNPAGVSLHLSVVSLHLSVVSLHLSVVSGPLSVAKRERLEARVFYDRPAPHGDEHQDQSGRRAAEAEQPFREAGTARGLHCIRRRSLGASSVTRGGNRRYQGREPPLPGAGTAPGYGAAPRWGEHQYQSGRRAAEAEQPFREAGTARGLQCLRRRSLGASSVTRGGNRRYQGREPPLAMDLHPVGVSRMPAAFWGPSLRAGSACAGSCTVSHTGG